MRIFKMKKLKIIGSGNKGKRNFFVFEKKDIIFSAFPLLLISLGFKNIGVYEDYQESPPTIEDMKNSIENFSNEEYDIDLIYTSNRIILIVRTDISNREKLILAIKKISYY